MGHAGQASSHSYHTSHGSCDTEQRAAFFLGWPASCSVPLTAGTRETGGSSLLAFPFPHRDGAAAAPQPGTVIGYGRRSCFSRAVFHTWRGGSVPPLRAHSPIGGGRLSWGPKPSSAGPADLPGPRAAGCRAERLPSACSSRGCLPAPRGASSCF